MVEKSKKAIQDFILMVVVMEVISLVVIINFPKWYIPFGKYLVPVLTLLGILVANNTVPCLAQLVKKQKVVSFNFPLFAVLTAVNLYSYRNIVMYSIMVNYKEVIISLVVSIICLKLYNSYAHSNLTIFDVLVLGFVKKDDKNKTKEKDINIPKKEKKPFTFFKEKKKPNVDTPTEKVS